MQKHIKLRPWHNTSIGWDADAPRRFPQFVQQHAKFNACPQRRSPEQSRHVRVDFPMTRVDFGIGLAAELERKSRSDGYRHDQLDESCVMA